MPKAKIPLTLEARCVFDKRSAKGTFSLCPYAQAVPYDWDLNGRGREVKRAIGSTRAYATPP